MACPLSIAAAFALSAHSGTARLQLSAPADRARAGNAAAASAATGPASHPSGSSSAGPGSAGSPAAASRSVEFAGRRFRIPADWTVTDLSADPTACVRFDRHTVYLGTPAPQERCPAQGVGRPVGAMLISAAAATQGTQVVQVDTSHSITATAPGVTVEASYGNDPSEVLAILGSANLGAGASPVPTGSASGARPSPGSAVPGSVGPRSATGSTIPTTAGMAGLGFDACAAPSAAAMQAWGTSPFTTVGIYIGGVDRACDQPNLTAAWVSQQAAAGWHFLPLYAGPQVTFGQVTAPQSQAAQAADDAVTQAAALGFTRGSVLYYDMEAYSATDSPTAVAFMSAWTQEIHAQGYLSGIYGSENSGIADLVANWGKISEPDVIDIAYWDGQTDSDPGADPAGHWTGRRVHQFLGGSNDSPTYGGYTINIDQDYTSLDGTRCEILVNPPVSPSPSSQAPGSVTWTSPLINCVASAS